MQDLFDLGGKTALVTGASSGMGKAIAEAMGLHGANIVVSSNDEAACKVNIRVNAISPGMIDTPFSKNLIENESFMKRRLALTPLRRVGTPAEIAGVAVMLASKAGAFMTGQNIIVDGGTVISDGN